jgi:hypothetical protein
MVTPHAREAAGVVNTDAADKARASKVRVKAADMVMAKVARAREITRPTATATIVVMTVAMTEAKGDTTKAKDTTKVRVRATRASVAKAVVARDVTTTRVAAMVVTAISNAATTRGRGTISPALPLISLLHRFPGPDPMCPVKSNSWRRRHQVSYR